MAAGYALRLAVGGLLLAAGIGKFAGGVGVFVEKSAGMFQGSLMPMGLATAFLSAVPLIEVVLGALILLGLFTKKASLLAGFLFALFVVGLAVTGNPDVYGMLANNFLFLFASLWLGKLPPGKVSLDAALCKGSCDT